ncbi:polysaccharide pyruvyl transferase YvfF [Aggregatibacter actinomycetemcomitans serotype e str. SC936]|uniref:polysaccharide pyruvyl transferase family protein n=1 Tax=Aggregatibacter actinomycetemcomitans TaxID=714 RepID=UPI00077E98D8|nr:polysaccharide pyruvyl transferase family protein [Aggregatibacter actinomycetemcomitans]KYK81349.1 polysaccharide pyruvyl transferase YvfF [Aggregatibacter actinomycetemcomitans serotype e str. SC936]
MNQQLIDLKHKLAPIADLIKDKNDVFYLDYPLHLNVGDLLIYHGTEQFFTDHNIHVRLKRSEYDTNIDEIKQKITPNTTILLHGGGNFGDLYPQHQNLREAIVQTFPNNRIIVLPQTLFYKNPKTLEKSTALFRQHPDCHLLARDERTAKDFEAFSPNVYLSPDMAHELYGTLPTKNTHTGKALYFLRKDIEASDIEKNITAQLPAGSHIKDWDDILSKRDSLVLALSWRLAKFANKYRLCWLKDLVQFVWKNYTLRIVKRVAQDFLGYDNITTTRLHGHIFSSLLEIPNVVCDNTYGKNTGYANLWTKGLDFVTFYK